jgi:hypothetical protein
LNPYSSNSTPTPRSKIYSSSGILGFREVSTEKSKNVEGKYLDLVDEGSSWFDSSSTMIVLI